MTGHWRNVATGECVPACPPCTRRREDKPARTARLAEAVLAIVALLLVLAALVVEGWWGVVLAGAGFLILAASIVMNTGRKGGPW